MSRSSGAVSDAAPSPGAPPTPLSVPQDGDGRRGPGWAAALGLCALSCAVCMGLDRALFRGRDAGCECTLRQLEEAKHHARRWQLEAARRSSRAARAASVAGSPGGDGGSAGPCPVCADAAAPAGAPIAVCPTCPAAAPPRDLPASCTKYFVPHPHIQHVFGVDSRATLGHRDSDEAKANQGGQWTPCTHLSHGSNFHFSWGFAKFLTFQLRPKSVLEFGCGLGTLVDYVSRFGGAHATCIEPERGLPEIFGRPRAPGSLRQLALMAFADGEQCSAALAGQGYDLVMSLEVAEHMPPSTSKRLVAFLAGASRRYVVFGAARPSQAGKGHINLRTQTQWLKDFQSEGLTYLPELSKLARRSAMRMRPYDYAMNTLVFGKGPDVHDIGPIERRQAFDIDPRIYHHTVTRSALDKSDGSRELERGLQGKQINPYYLEPQVPAVLWPDAYNLYALIRDRKLNIRSRMQGRPLSPADRSSLARCGMEPEEDGDKPKGARRDGDWVSWAIKKRKLHNFSLGESWVATRRRPKERGRGSRRGDDAAPRRRGSDADPNGPTFLGRAAPRRRHRSAKLADAGPV